MINTPTIKGEYQGQLRCAITHQNSNSTLVTDAPIDNNGKGEAFSPTDLVAGALATCMLTIIGIRANVKNIEIGMPHYSILKIMQNTPRKISAIEIEIALPIHLNNEERNYLEQEAMKCPVALSLSDSVQQKINFNYI